MHKKLKNTIDYFVGLKNGVIGIVKYYVSHNDIKYAILKEYEVLEEIDQLLDVEPTSVHICAPVESIVSKYIYFNVNKKKYIVLPPNKIENG